MLQLRPIKYTQQTINHDICKIEYRIQTHAKKRRVDYPDTRPGDRSTEASEILNSRILWLLNAVRAPAVLLDIIRPYTLVIGYRGRTI